MRVGLEGVDLGAALREDRGNPPDVRAAVDRDLAGSHVAEHAPEPSRHGRRSDKPLTCRAECPADARGLAGRELLRAHHRRLDRVQERGAHARHLELADRGDRRRPGR